MRFSIFTPRAHIFAKSFLIFFLNRWDQTLVTSVIAGIIFAVRPQSFK